MCFSSRYPSQVDILFSEKSKQLFLICMYFVSLLNTIHRVDLQVNDLVFSIEGCSLKDLGWGEKEN